MYKKYWVDVQKVVGQCMESFGSMCSKYWVRVCIANGLGAIDFCLSVLSTSLGVFVHANPNDH